MTRIPDFATVDLAEPTAAAVATAGSLLPLRKVMQLDPAPALRGE